MKELKIIFAIIIVFIIAFATSALLDIAFVARNWMRYALVILIILLELYIGFMYVKSEVSKIKSE
jgi:uncharacterized membrane protein